jgi:hypothetical protein
MGRNRQRADLRHHRLEHNAHLRRVGIAHGVGHHEFVRTGLGQQQRVFDDVGNRHSALEGTAERGGQPARDARAPALGLRLDQFDYPREIGDRFLALAAHVLEIVGLAHRHDEIELVDAEHEAALGAFGVRDQRRHREPRDRQRAPRDFLGIDELGNQFWRHIGGDLDFANARRRLGLDPGDLALGRHERGVDLQAVAQAHFAHCDIDLLHFIFL